MRRSHLAAGGFCFARSDGSTVDANTRGKAEFDSGDHLHPNGAGYVAMADSIDLGALLENKK